MMYPRKVLVYMKDEKITNDVPDSYFNEYKIKVPYEGILDLCRMV
jgi:hypothetical protein